MVCGFVVAVSLGLCATAVHADTFVIGQELTNRAQRDSGQGNLFGAEVFGFSEGTVRRWSVRGQATSYTGTRDLTPLILEQTGAGGLGSVTVRGIGTTRVLPHSTDVQTFDFGLRSGSSRMGPRHYFGWVDSDGAGAANQGTMSYGDGNHHTLWFGGGGVVATGRVHALSRNLNRRYSLQVTIDIDRGEAIGNGASQRGLTEPGLGGVFVQDSPFTQAGHLTQWAFWSWTDGTRSITPLILEQVGGAFVLRGVGTSRAPAANQGTMTYDFGLQSGTNAVAARHYFGWVDASVDYTSGDPTSNAGVAWYAGDEFFSSKARFLGNGHTAGTFLPGRDFGAGTLQNKAYSVQALSVIPAGGALTVSSQHGTPVPSGEHGYFPGSVVTASVDDVVTSGATQYVCMGWAGTGSALESGTTNTAVFTITNDSTVVWLWGTNYYLDVTAHPGGTTDVHSGWFALGSDVTVTAFAINGGTVAWSGNTNGCTFPSATRITCPMDGPRAIVVDFLVATNAYLTVISAHGDAVPATGMIHQYAPGSSVDTSVTNSPVTAGTTQYVCTGWSRVGSEPDTGSGTNSSFTITEHTTQTWHWATNYYLDVVAKPGGTTDVHSAFFPSGTNVTVTGYPTNDAFGVSWSGDTDGCTIVSNAITCPMDQPRTIVAEFPTLTDGLMAYWNFDEGGSTVVLDPYGKVGDAGALAGGTAAPAWVDGKVGSNALEFNGSNFASAAYSSDIGQLTGSSITSAITIQAWVRFDTSAPGSHDILDKRPTNNTGGWTLEIDGDNLSWWINNGGGGGNWNLCRATGAIPGWLGQWTHLVLTWQSGTKMKMVVNDATTFESAAPVGETIFFRSDFLYLGAHISGNDRFLDGAIDEVTIWNRALSAGEIAALYNGGDGRPVTSGLRAADISSVPVTQESDVRGAGNTLLAKSFGAASDFGAAQGGTVNGVTLSASPGTNHAEFSSSANSVWPDYDASTSLSGDLDSIFSGTMGLDARGTSPNRRSVLTLTGLEPGMRYRLQWLSAAEGQTTGFWTFRNRDQGDVIATVGRHPSRNTRISFRATNTTQRIHVQEVPTAAPLINGYVLQQVQTVRPTVHASSPGWNRLANLVNGTTPNPADANFATGFDRWPAGDLKSDDAYNVHGNGASAQGQAYALTNTNPWLVFDMGAPENLATLLLWNGNQQTDRQARSFDVRVSDTDDFSSATVLKVTGLPNRPISAARPADAIDLSALGSELAGARYVRLDNFVNYGDPDFLVLSEVRFEVRATAPGPEGTLIIVR